jgi:hypothetical protein
MKRLAIFTLVLFATTVVLFGQEPVKAKRHASFAQFVGKKVASVPACYYYKVVSARAFGVDSLFPENVVTLSRDHANRVTFIMHDTADSTAVSEDITFGDKVGAGVEFDMQNPKGAVFKGLAKFRNERLYLAYNRSDFVVRPKNVKAKAEHSRLMVLKEISQDEYLTTLRRIKLTWSK